MYRRVHGSSIIQRIRDGAFIPPDPNNRDYAEFLRLGAVLLDAEPLPTQVVGPSPEDLISSLAELLGVDAEQLVASARSRAASKR
jgi:hypothetical protein